MSAFFAVYDNAGNIIRSGSCPANLVAKQARNPGEAACAVPKICCDIEDRIVKGVMQKRPAGEIAARRAKLEKDMEEGPKSAKNRLDKYEKIFKFLKKKGIDLGPDGEDL